MNDVCTMSGKPQRPPTHNTRDPIALARKLVPDGELTEADRQTLAELRMLGEPAIDELLACALTPRSLARSGLSYVDANETRAKAIYALAQLPAERAVEPILRALLGSKPHSAERSFLGSCCILLGPLALEPALRLCRTSPLGPSDALLMLLAHLGIRDARILEHLLSFLPINPAGAASLLGIYGDPAALPTLKELQERLPSDQAPGDDKYLREAIARLGGDTAAKPAASPGSRAPATQRVPASTAPRPRTQGRNEPCACGSGKKFKVCCYRRS